MKLITLEEANNLLDQQYDYTLLISNIEKNTVKCVEVYQGEGTAAVKDINIEPHIRYKIKQILEQRNEELLNQIEAL